MNSSTVYFDVSNQLRNYQKFDEALHLLQVIVYRAMYTPHPSCSFSLSAIEFDRRNCELRVDITGVSSTSFSRFDGISTVRSYSGILAPFFIANEQDAIDDFLTYKKVVRRLLLTHLNYAHFYLDAPAACFFASKAMWWTGKWAGDPDAPD